MSANPKLISGYTTTYNCIKMCYPFRECIVSMLGFCDEVCIADAGSEDGTLEELYRFQSADPRIKIEVCPVDFSHSRWAIHQDGYLKSKARAMCTGNYCWQTDTDEFVVPRDFEKIRKLPEIMGEHQLFMLPMVEFWGSFDCIRADFLSFKPRFSVNDKRITHGIPNRHKLIDSNGHPYPRPFLSDSCNYIYADSGEDVAVCTPLPPGCASYEELVRDLGIYQRIFMSALELLPAPLHLSWLDIGRKIRHYKEYWQKFHASMYNLDIKDSAASNVMFDKPWSEVTEQDIVSKAAELIRIGPRNFHSKIDPTKHGSTLYFPYPIPKLLLDWASSQGITPIYRQDQHA